MEAVGITRIGFVGAGMTRIGFHGMLSFKYSLGVTTESKGTGCCDVFYVKMDDLIGVIEAVDDYGHDSDRICACIQCDRV